VEVYPPAAALLLTPGKHPLHPLHLLPPTLPPAADPGGPSGRPARPRPRDGLFLSISFGHAGAWACCAGGGLLLQSLGNLYEQLPALLAAAAGQRGVASQQLPPLGEAGRARLQLCLLAAAWQLLLQAFCTAEGAAGSQLQVGGVARLLAAAPHPPTLHSMVLLAQLLCSCCPAA
jgi:hypothetical protein